MADGGNAQEQISKVNEDRNTSGKQVNNPLEQEALGLPKQAGDLAAGNEPEALSARVWEMARGPEAETQIDWQQQANEVWEKMKTDPAEARETGNYNKLREAVTQVVKQKVKDLNDPNARPATGGTELTRLRTNLQILREHGVEFTPQEKKFDHVLRVVGENNTNMAPHEFLRLSGLRDQGTPGVTPANLVGLNQKIFEHGIHNPDYGFSFDNDKRTDLQAFATKLGITEAEAQATYDRWLVASVTSHVTENDAALLASNDAKHRAFVLANWENTLKINDPDGLTADDKNAIISKYKIMTDFR